MGCTSWILIYSEKYGFENDIYTVFKKKKKNKNSLIIMDSIHHQHSKEIYSGEYEILEVSDPPSSKSNTHTFHVRSGLHTGGAHRG